LQQKLVAAVDEVGKVSSADDVVSPFQEAETTSEEELVIRPVTAKGLDFTIENIDTVLDEIRPYLIADGGNVAIVSIDEGTRSIQLALQGACGSCPSSTTTMKMGIERVLKENFAYLGAITAIDPAAAAAALSPKQLDPEKVKDVLDKVLPAIKGMGGIAELDEIVTSTGVVKMKFKGPARLKKGVELALKDVEYVTSVVFDDA
jgi:Fe-S cluster biogenesis protein NfuA